jgi:hypothetical protein
VEKVSFKNYSVLRSLILTNLSLSLLCCARAAPYPDSLKTTLFQQCTSPKAFLAPALDSDSGSDGSDSSSTTSISVSQTEKPIMPSFPTGVGTAVVSTAELVDAVSAASVATAKALGPKLPSASF